MGDTDDRTDIERKGRVPRFLLVPNRETVSQKLVTIPQHIYIYRKVYITLEVCSLLRLKDARQRGHVSITKTSQRFGRSHSSFLSRLHRAQRCGPQSWASQWWCPYNKYIYQPKSTVYTSHCVIAHIARRYFIHTMQVVDFVLFHFGSCHRGTPMRLFLYPSSLPFNTLHSLYTILGLCDLYRAQYALLYSCISL